MEKSHALRLVAEKIQICKKCPDLCDSRLNVVPGTGNPNARIMFIGEAPGQKEDEDGIPFVGRAGKLLTNIIKACGLTREEVFISNILKCRPPGNRNPTAEEAKNCRPFLDLQIKVVNPQYIVCLGGIAAQNLLGTEEKISYLRGRFLDYNGIKVLCTYHPSFLLRNPHAKKDVAEDLQLLLKEIR